MELLKFSVGLVMATGEPDLKSQVATIAPVG